MEETFYTEDFFNNQMPISKKSASVILPELHKLFPFTSLLDVGCGTGEWLSIAEKELGIQDIIGLDGDYVNKKQLAISDKNFLSMDLKQPFNLERKFSLVLSAEVAEHLPENVSKQFIKTLCLHGNLVLFSAAAPGQGGTYHINEQWQDYWVSLFGEEDFIAIDFMRKKFWHKKGIDWWYKQNMLLFVRKESLQDYPNLLPFLNQPKPESFNLIHPEMIFAQKGIHTSFGRFTTAPIYSIRKALSFMFN